MSDPAKKAHQILVNAGVKSDFATKVVEKSGHSPDEIIKNPVKILGDYWYSNVNVDFLHDAVAVNAAEFRKGLTALELQASVVDKAVSSAPRPELLGHRDIFGWGLVIVQGRLS